MKRLLSVVVFHALVSCWPAYGQPYTITTFAGGGLPVNMLGKSASLGGALTGIAVDKSGNVFVADANQNVVLKMDATSGVFTLVAGNGTSGISGDNGLATSAQLSNPANIAMDSVGNLYIADLGNERIRKVSNGVITTVAGNGSFGFSGDNGPAISAQLESPLSVAVDAAGNLYIADSLNNRIRKVANGVITTVAGNGTAGFSGDSGLATNAQLAAGNIAVDAAGNLYIVSGNRIRKVSSGVITTVVGNGTTGFGGDNGPAINAQLNNPQGIALDSVGNIYFADSGNGRIREVSNGVITTIAGNGDTRSYDFDGNGGFDSGPAIKARLGATGGVAIDSGGNVFDIGNGFISEISEGVITRLAGNGVWNNFSGDAGPPLSAQLSAPRGVAVDSTGAVYIADTGNCHIRKISNGVIATVAGNTTRELQLSLELLTGKAVGACDFSGDNGPATNAQLNNPAGIALDSAGSLYIADSGNNRIRKVMNGVITTVVGNGTAGFAGDNGPATSASLNNPMGVAVDSTGNLYIADSQNHRIRRVANGVITTVAGNGLPDSSGDNGPATSASLNNPMGVAVDPSGNLYIADTNNFRVRKVSNGVISTFAHGGSTFDIVVPFGIAVDSAGNVYTADSEHIHRISNGVITTIAGEDCSTNGSSSSHCPDPSTDFGDNGPATLAELYEAFGVAVDSAGNVYVAHYPANRIRLLTPGTVPLINQGGIVPVYSALPVIQSGSWVSIYGSNLASGTSIWNGNFPMTLGGTSVTIDNKPAYLWFVSPTQINLQVPDDAATGPVSVVVTTATGMATSTVTLSSYGPSFSVLGDGKHVAAEILTPDGTGAYGSYDLVGPSNTFSYNTRPARAGETLVLFGVGFGPTTPLVPPGRIFSGAAPTSTPVTMTIGGVKADVSFAGITEAGLYQFNVTVPNAPSGEQALQATVNGTQTSLGPLVTIQ